MLLVHLVFLLAFPVHNKIKTLNSKAPLTNILYDLVSSSNVDYQSNFREYYISYFPSFGEIKIGKQFDSDSHHLFSNLCQKYTLLVTVFLTKIKSNNISTCGS